MTERVRRIGAYFTKTSKKGGASRWASFEEAVQELRSFSGEPRRRDLFLEGIEASRARQTTEYVAVIKGLGHEARTEGTAWLEDIVEAATRRMSGCLLHP